MAYGPNLFEPRSQKVVAKRLFESMGGHQAAHFSALRSHPPPHPEPEARRPIVVNGGVPHRTGGDAALAADRAYEGFAH